MSIEWTQDLNTGIDVIDQQHRQLVDYINQLKAAAATGDRQRIGHVLDDLLDYTLSHFAFEEKMVADAGYTLAKPHKDIHDLFVRRVTRYRERHAAGDDIAIPLHNMLTTWLLHHIKRDDKAYVTEVQPRITQLVQDRHEGGWLHRTLHRFFGQATPATP